MLTASILYYIFLSAFAVLAVMLVISESLRWRRLLRISRARSARAGGPGQSIEAKPMRSPSSLDAIPGLALDAGCYRGLVVAVPFDGPPRVAYQSEGCDIRQLAYGFDAAFRILNAQEQLVMQHLQDRHRKQFVHHRNAAADAPPPDSIARVWTA